MRNRLLLGVIVAMLLSACAAAVAEAFPKPCVCRFSCWPVCAKAEKQPQKFLMSEGQAGGWSEENRSKS